MANTILHKRNSNSGATPSTNSLTPGELAINTADGKVFTKTTGGAVVEIGALPTNVWAVGSLVAGYGSGNEVEISQLTLNCYHLTNPMEYFAKSHYFYYRDTLGDDYQCCSFSSNGVEISSDLGLRLRSGGVNYTNLKTATTVSSTWTMRLPSSAGSANQVLKTDGSGNTSWETVKPLVVDFTSNGSYTVPSWATRLEMYAYGGGGGGGGGNWNSSTTAARSGGGGGGGCHIGFMQFLVSDIGTAGTVGLTITVGAGGTAGAAGATSGSPASSGGTGGTTTITRTSDGLTLLTIAGGSGGGGGSPSSGGSGGGSSAINNPSMFTGGPGSAGGNSGILGAGSMGQVGGTGGGGGGGVSTANARADGGATNSAPRIRGGTQVNSTSSDGAVGVAGTAAVYPYPGGGGTGGSGHPSGAGGAGGAGARGSGGGGGAGGTTAGGIGGVGGAGFVRLIFT